MEENLKRNIVNKIFDMQETEICHNPYDHEQRKLFSIESGDLRQLRRCQKEKYEGRLGRVADEDLRNDKNIAIIVITLASRAAIRGGISPELAFTMADNYICDIERQKDKKVIAKKAEEYEEEFARQVMEAKKSPETNHYVEKAKDYIYKHLHNIEFDPIRTELWDDPAITENKDNKFLAYFTTNPFDILKENGTDITAPNISGSYSATYSTLVSTTYSNAFEISVDQDAKELLQSEQDSIIY